MCHYKMCTTLLLVCLSFLHVTEGLPASNFPLGSKPNPGKSCKDLLAHGGTVTGNYYIRLGGQTLLVYCDQVTAGGGWTLVYSYSFSEDKHFKELSINCMPKPNWTAFRHTPISTTPPKSETDYNAMDFNLWKKLGTEFILKSNLNNWYTCSDGTGSLVFWRKGTIHCKLLKNLVGKCGDVVPDNLNPRFYSLGPNFYDRQVTQYVLPLSIYFLRTDAPGVASIDPCGHYNEDPAIFNITNPRGNIYVR